MTTDPINSRDYRMLYHALINLQLQCKSKLAIIILSCKLNAKLHNVMRYYIELHVQYNLQTMVIQGIQRKYSGSYVTITWRLFAILVTSAYLSVIQKHKSLHTVMG